MFLSKEWLLQGVWFGIFIFCLLMDGEFVTSGISHHVLWATIIMSIINCIPTIFDKIKDLNFKYSSGSVELNASSNNIYKNTDNESNT
jgi:hypothetical protein